MVAKIHFKRRPGRRLFQDVASLVVLLAIYRRQFGDQASELNSTFPSEEEQEYIRLIWDEVPPNPYTVFDSPNIPTMDDIYNELLGL